jgi:hypothetical protein
MSGTSVPFPSMSHASIDGGSGPFWNMYVTKQTKSEMSGPVPLASMSPQPKAYRYGSPIGGGGSAGSLIRVWTGLVSPVVMIRSGGMVDTRDLKTDPDRQVSTCIRLNPGNALV